MTQVNTKYSNSMEEITALIKAKVPIIWVLTYEEERFVADFTKTVAMPLDREVWLWSAYQGLIKEKNSGNYGRATGSEAETWNAQKALNCIADMEKPNNMRGSCFIMRDFHIVFGEPIPRQMRDMFNHLSNSKKTLILVSPMLAHGAGGTKTGIPPTLEKQISVIRYELPTPDQISNRIKSIFGDMQKAIANAKAAGNKKTFKSKVEYTDEEIKQFTRICQGLTLQETDQALCTSITHLQEVNPDKLINDKRQLIRKSEILEFIETPVENKDIGGLDLAKDYLVKYSKAYSEEAEAFGVEPLRAVLLVGVPGCLHADTVIYDPIAQTNFTVKKRHEQNIPFFVNSLTANGEKVVAQALPPIKYEKAKMVEFMIDNDQSIKVTLGHRFLTSDGWMTAQNVIDALEQGDEVHLLSSLDDDLLTHEQDVQHLKQTAQDFLNDCQPYRYFYDAQLHQTLNNDQDVVPLSSDAREHNLSDYCVSKQRLDVHQGRLLTHNRVYQELCRPYKQSYDGHSVLELAHQNVLETHKLCFERFDTFQQSLSVANLEHTSRQLPCHAQESTQDEHVYVAMQHFDNSVYTQSDFLLQFPQHQAQLLSDGKQFVQSQQFVSSSYLLDKDEQHFDDELYPILPLTFTPLNSNTTTKYNRFVSYKQVNDDFYYDFHVPGYHNYEACGIYHHNTGKSLLSKAIGKMWQIPLLKLDIGKVMGSLVGQSESKMREVINQAESMAPCVVGDTEINTKTHGTITMNTLHELLTTTDEQVMIDTFNPDTNTVVETPINTVIRREASQKRLLKLTSESGNTITVTDNHKLLIKDSNNDLVWVEAKDLKEGDEVIEVAQ